MLRLILTLLAHYRKHPLQGVFLLTGIIVANVLLVGTLLINAQARASYAQGELTLGNMAIGQIQHKNSRQLINESDFVVLRRAGFDVLVPQLRQMLLTLDGATLDISGLDAFAVPRPALEINNTGEQSGDTASITRFAFPPYRLWAAPARMKQLELNNGDQIQLASGGQLPPIDGAAGQQLGHRLLMDLKALQSITGQHGKLSSILVFPTSAARQRELLDSLPQHLKYIANDSLPDPAELTSSFHLNLAAMGLLACVVGLFLTYNAIAFSYTDRHDLLRKLRLAGVLKSELRIALLLELALFLGIGVCIGAWLGALLSAQLLPGVGQSLAQLYGVYIAYPDQLITTGIWLPIGMTVLSALLCVAFPLREVLNAPLLERRQPGWNHRAVLRRDRILAVTAGLFLLLAALSALLASDLLTALAGMACLLLAAAFLLPLVLRILISTALRLLSPRHARISWLLADSRWLLGPASLALMAMTMALVANSGLNTMINSFRVATEDWLDQRLLADLYISGTANIVDLENWLADEMPTLTLAERYVETATLPRPDSKMVRVEMVSLRSGNRFRDSVALLQDQTDARDRFEKGEGIFISERAWRIEGWQSGQTVDICSAQSGLTVLGIYRDYGNPWPQWMLPRDTFLSCWPQDSPAGLALYGPEDTAWEDVRQSIAGRFQLGEDKMINQHELKAIGMAVFDRTFVVTHALNALTLLVAAIGIFCAISAIHHHRVSRQALLTALGLNRRERGLLLLLQWGLLGLFSMALVWPAGTLLAGYLGTVVTPVAFGWSFPLVVEWHHFVILALLAAACLVAAVLVPSIRLIRTSPATMLREQNL